MKNIGVRINNEIKKTKKREIEKNMNMKNVK